MREKKQTKFGNLLYAATPLALYYLMSMIISIVYSRILIGKAGFAALESGTGEAGVMDYFQEALISRTMEIVMVTVVVGVPLFAWIYYRDLVRREDFHFKGLQIELEVGPLLWSVLGSAALAVLLNLLVMLTPLMDWSSSFEQVQEGLYSGTLLTELVAAGIGSPVLEELLIRGSMYGRLKESMDARGAIFWSALIFGIFHQNIVQGVYAFLMGLFFAYLMEWFGTVLVPILAHMSANIVILLLSEYDLLGRFMSSRTIFATVVTVCLLVILQNLKVLKLRKN